MSLHQNARLQEKLKEISCIYERITPKFYFTWKYVLNIDVIAFVISCIVIKKRINNSFIPNITNVYFVYFIHVYYSLIVRNFLKQRIFKLSMSVLMK